MKRAYLSNQVNWLTWGKTDWFGGKLNDWGKTDWLEGKLTDWEKTDWFEGKLTDSRENQRYTVYKVHKNQIPLIDLSPIQKNLNGVWWWITQWVYQTCTHNMDGQKKGSNAVQPTTTGVIRYMVCLFVCLKLLTQYSTKLTTHNPFEM